MRKTKNEKPFHLHMASEEERAYEPGIKKIKDKRQKTKDKSIPKREKCCCF